MQKKKAKRIPVTEIVLATIAGAGLIGLAAIAPGALGMIRAFRPLHRRYQTPTYVNSVVAKLRRDGLVTVRMERGEPLVRLTEKGDRALAHYRLSKARPKNQKWDNKWRIVIFDIHEWKRGTRDRVRNMIAQFGFQRLQQSVWVYPYECEELIQLLKADVKIGEELLYVIAERIENEDWLKRKFGLPLHK